jgi:hypothetical protein
MVVQVIEIVVGETMELLVVVGFQRESLTNLVAIDSFGLDEVGIVFGEGMRGYQG